MDRICAMALDIGGTNIKSGLVGPDGQIFHQETRSTEALAGKSALLSKLGTIVEQLSQKAGDLGLRPIGIGVGTAGYVNRAGIVGGATANLPEWRNMDLKAELGRRFSYPIAVDNDVNAMALGEHWLGAGRNRRDFLCIALGTGVGGCVMADGRIFRGRDGFAGAYGHLRIMLDGLPCSCGLHGCWEQYASVTALKRMIGEMPAAQGSEMTPKALFAAARGGDVPSMRAVERYAEYIAAGLATLIHTLNPPAIIIGGAVTAQGDFLFDPIREQLKRCTLDFFLSPEVPVIPAQLGDMAGMIGAARLALDAGGL